MSHTLSRTHDTTERLPRQGIDEPTLMLFTGRTAIRGRRDITLEQATTAINVAAALTTSRTARSFTPSPQLVETLRGWGFDEPIESASIADVYSSDEPNQEAVVGIQMGDEYGRAYLYFSAEAAPGHPGTYTLNPNFYVAEHELGNAQAVPYAYEIHSAKY